ncbi:MAG: vitamin B12-dependent ribonucleotide reductase [Bacteroidota bacterium]|nr:vitamin B12-dependent ribonucleotide reductase [Bacteroidota bacterium]MDE2834564.1 vitamin B12-dependent ribonucleotide reductase [Bacteroidota bacterium]MDE2957029.1 vitamin B12-dependent ribonucleotide reductase [Bacteroidota bacterium]
MTSEQLELNERSTDNLQAGLTVDRVFSTRGTNPFDSVEWERRDAAIRNPAGEAVFEQRNVEFPRSWSPLASNVVASKYFYGDQNLQHLDPDEGGREFSLRQLIHRVTRTIADWGYEQKYFFSKAEADAFYDELTWLCVNQYGSFNSPVWFNVGLHQRYGIQDTGGRVIHGWDFEEKKVTQVDPYRRPQGSACFIISIDDSIDDIWRLMSESARLFKFGSGVGADWSTLRSTREKLSGGGIPSGPVSFMHVQDATGGTIKSGGKTRRAAIMQTLKVWHPDILEFVDAKKEEERKAWALIEQGYDGSFNGPAYGSVAFQNVNQSVRVTDEFMRAVDQGGSFGLRMVRSGAVIEQVDAASLLDRVSDGTHVCGDPGLQYEDTIQRWHTCSASGPINSSNPCSEYMFLDDSACNLASLNLRKFQQDGVFDVERFRAATRIFITAMEIIVDNAGYPSKAIAENSHSYRPLGLGFANLGALIMAMGLPYDSEQGRAVAGAIMAIEHAEAYARSAEIAANSSIGPFEGFAANRESMLNVMRMHQAAADEIPASCPKYLLRGAKESLAKMVELGERFGYRNAQATVLAPTGTIAFMMDCDTTGIEPDIALVKYKLLAGKGDGVLKIVNRTVPEALQRLGYSQEAMSAIIGYVDTNDTIEGAPGLSAEHLPVFDCAFKPMNGKRSIHSMGHVRMMAACQPFVSGAISKTVNMPEEVTTQEISEAYMEGWRLGLKALAIYRENSKRSQPLSTSEGGNTKQSAESASSGDGVAIESGSPAASTPPEVVYGPPRKRLPDERPAFAHKFSLSGHEGYLHVGLYPDSGLPGEIFITMAKQGSTISGLMDAFATSVSIALQYGVPLEDLCHKFAHMRFEPAGFTNNRRIPQASSVMDYIFRYLSQKFLRDPSESESTTDGVRDEVERAGPAEDQTQMQLPFYDGHQIKVGPVSIAYEPKKAAEKVTEPAPAMATAEHGVYQGQGDAPPCSNCGAITVRSGACFVCLQCGSTSGCG